MFCKCDRNQQSWFWHQNKVIELTLELGEDLLGQLLLLRSRLIEINVVCDISILSGRHVGKVGAE